MTQKYSEETKRKRRAYTKEWKKKNSVRVKETKKAWDTKNKDYVLSAAKAFSLKWRYGITPDDYQRMMEEQGGVCKICGNPPSGRFALSVDHDHRTQRVRGLLCGKCNFAIGHANDNPALLRKMAKYLEEA